MNFINKNTYNLSYRFLKSIQSNIFLYKEIHMKYSLSRFPTFPNEKMYYKNPDRFLLEIYRSISIHSYFSIFFEEMTNKRDFYFLFSSIVNIFKENLQAMILRSSEVSGMDNSQMIGKLLHKKPTHHQLVERLSRVNNLENNESDTLNPSVVLIKYCYNANGQNNVVDSNQWNQRTHSQFVERLSDRNNLQRRERDILNPPGVSPKYDYKFDSQNNIVESNERHQRIKPATGNEVNGVGSRAITPFPFWDLPQSWRRTTTTQGPSTMPVVYAQSPVPKDMASNSYDNVFTSGRTLLDREWHTRVLTIATTLTTTCEGRVGTPIVGIPQSVHLPGDSQPALREWPAPLINHPLLEAAMGTAADSQADSIANATYPFTVILSTGRLEPPQLSYAFAQPKRSILQDEHAIVTVREKEIVKVVQKEVQSLMSSNSVVKYLSRADYAQIANNVYSSLTRQLMVERERLGI